MTDRPTSTADQKTDFTTIYTQPDPRAYFRTLMPLEYQIPQNALPFMEATLAATPEQDRPRAILDVCCSYGINAALLRTDCSMADLGERYAGAEVAELSTEEMVERDREFYRSRLRHRERRILGLDAAGPAVRYAVEAGLLDDGWDQDLESADPTADLAAGLRDVDLIVCTGGVGYIGQPTFDRLVAANAAPDRVRVVACVLRVFDYAPIAESLAGYGLVTERVPGPSLRQRRFTDAEERDGAVRLVRDRGLDPAGLEEDGWYYADCFVSGPPA